MAIDIYELKHLDTYDRMVQLALQTSPSYTMLSPRGLETITIKGVGNADLEDLDAKWMKGLVLYASTHGVKAVTTPMYSQTFFAYVTSGPGRPIDREYNL